MSVSERVLKKIRKHELKPKPRWIFSLKNYFLWIFGLSSLIVGSFAFSVIIYMLENNDWEIYERVNSSLLGFIFLTLPYFWLIILLGLILVVHYNLRHTKKGYRYRLLTIVVAVVVLSMLLGAALYNTGVGQAIDETFAEKVPIYEEFVNKMNQKKKMWMQPEKGLLVGVVVSVKDEDNFRISDFNNQVWVINTTEAKIEGPFRVAVSNVAQVVGEEYYDPIIIQPGERGFKAELVMVKPNPRLLKRHPGPMKVMIEMRSGGKEVPNFIEEDLWHQEYSDENDKSISGCQRDFECQVPFEDAVRSNCPFESRCLNGVCETVCIEPYASREDMEKNRTQCDYKTNCDCEFYRADDIKDCLCLNGRCAVIVK